MTITAIRQFISLVGGEAIAKGEHWEEPSRRPQLPVAFVMGQNDYVCSALHCGTLAEGHDNPFVVGSADAAYYAAGRFRERRDERSVVDAFAREAGR